MISRRAARRAYRSAAQEAIGEAMRRGHDCAVVVVDDPAPAGYTALLPDFRHDTAADASELGGWPDGARADVFDLRPVSYADLREMHRAAAGGDERRLEEIGDRLVSVSEAMVGGPGRGAADGPGGGLR